MMLNRIPLSPPVIEPVAENIERPLWSVMIPTFNCTNYLKKTLTAVLSQNMAADCMQIEVIDDCSTDGNVEKLVNEIGKGRIGFFKQEHNVGSLRNFETCIKRSRGKLIHLLHGDDMIKEGFYKEIESLFNENPIIGAAFTGLSVIDESDVVLYSNNLVQPQRGVIENWILKISTAQQLRTCAIVVKRNVYEQLGGFYAVHYGEDWEMFVRIAATFPVAYSPKNLALYRIHQNNISARYLASGQNIKDIKTVINIIQLYLPVEKRKRIKKISLQNFSIYFTGNAQGIYKQSRNAKLALKQAHGALGLNFNTTTFTSLLKLYIKVLINYKVQK